MLFVKQAVVWMIQLTGKREAHKWIDPETGKEYTNTSTDALYKFDFKNNNAWKNGCGLC